MSNILYPLGIISNHKVTPYNNVQCDAFEDGTTSSRLIWPAQNFKRQFDFVHQNLTLAEYRYLRSFYSQRSGAYDSFWYRDNVNRKGNALVRFAAPIVDTNDGPTFTIPVKLQEIAPIRALPEWDEVTAAAGGNTPVLWYDCNREFWLQHVGMNYSSLTTWDASTQKYPAPWTAGALDLTTAATQQYPPYGFNSGNWAITSSNISELAGFQPACTIFVIANLPNTGTKSIICAAGAVGSTGALGIAISSVNYFEPWVGNGQTWSGTRFANPGNYVSYAVVWPASSGAVTAYGNAAIVGTDVEARQYSAGPFSMGAAPNGSQPVIGGANHFLLFAGALTLAQIKAVHNLLGYQYGLPVVA